MSRSQHRGFVAALRLSGALALCSGCAPVPLPQAVNQADEVAKSPAVAEAKRYAAAEVALAEKRRRLAHEALEHEPQARAQFLAEQALALYEAAISASRQHRASLRLEQAKTVAEASEQELAQLTQRTRGLQAEVAALELRFRVARDRELAKVSAPASKEREAARREAAEAQRVRGLMLCSAARLLGAGSAQPAPVASPTTATQPEDPSAPGVLARDLVAAEALVSELSEALEKRQGATPIDLAHRAHAACLSVLSRTRQAAPPEARSGVSQQLLDDLSKAGWAPSRDERGVVVTLRDALTADGISARGTERLAALGRVASAAGQAKLLVVFHSDKPARKPALWEQQAALLLQALSGVPDDRKKAVVAGNADPVLAGNNAKNARVEVVFISPEVL